MTQILVHPFEGRSFRSPIEELAPPIDRSPIGEPSIEMLDQEPVVPSGTWVDVLKRRNKIGRGITLMILSVLVGLNYLILSAEGKDIYSIVLYTGLYAIMTYFLFIQLVKTIIGRWATRHNQNIADHPSNSARDPDQDTRVAIIFPVYHEDVARVAGGMAACWESLDKHTPDFAERYDIFLLSDSRKDEYVDAEIAAVQYLRKRYPAARFYYRWRPTNTHAKIGNVTDFCRRWGNSYKYMFTMDADSIVSGETIHATLRMMEGRPQVGILQTNPKAVFRQTIFGRMQQFSGNIFGRAFSAALQATMLGNAVYMGHNAMVRIKPFMDHCILPSLSGPSPWGGKPLSHDIVESALMAAHGYETWFLPELEGSWEEVPANILSMLIRERRWMQGNLQHGRLIGRKSIPFAYKEYFLNGIFSYMSAPIWAVFLVVSSYMVINFIKSGLLDPETAELITTYMGILGLSTLAVFLFIRAVAVGSVFTVSKSKLYGGKMGILASVVIEFIFSMIYSPIVMMAMSKFIYLWVRRKSIVWGVQDRGDEQLSWDDCFRHFGWMSLVGMVVAAGFIWLSSTIPDQDIGLMMAVSHGLLNPYVVVYYLAPVLTGIILAPLIVRVSSRPMKYFEKAGLFVIPEETNIPKEFDVCRQVEGALRLSLPHY